MWIFPPCYYYHQLGLLVVQSLGRVRLFATPWTAAHQASLSFTISQSLLKLMSIELWCHPTISSSVAPFSSSPLSFPALRLLYQLPEAFTTKFYRWGVLNNRHLFAHCCGSWKSEIRVSRFGSLWRRWGKNAFQASVLDLDTAVFSLYLRLPWYVYVSKLPFQRKTPVPLDKVNLNNLHSNSECYCVSRFCVCIFSDVWLFLTHGL